MVLPADCTLTGYAIPSVYTISLADHTYVKSSLGDVWPCFGGSEGGSSVCSGPAVSSVANCLSANNAQIIYGVTGVCHQTANRILYPAGIFVSEARGYSASVCAYGTYGIGGGWPDLLTAQRCHIGLPTPIVGLPSITREPKAGAAKQGEKSAAYMQEVLALYKSDMLRGADLMLRGADLMLRKEGVTKGIQDLLNRELELVAEYKSDGKLPENKINSMQSAQRDFLKEKEEAEHAWYARKLSHEEFVEEVNSLFRHFLRQCEQILTENEFKILFDVDVGHTFNLVDPEIAANALK